jgi:hypothetical protein
MNGIVELAPEAGMEISELTSAVEFVRALALRSRARNQARAAELLLCVANLLSEASRDLGVEEQDAIH